MERNCEDELMIKMQKWQVLVNQKMELEREILETYRQVASMFIVVYVSGPDSQKFLIFNTFERVEGIVSLGERLREKHKIHVIISLAYNHLEAKIHPDFFLFEYKFFDLTTEMKLCSTHTCVKDDYDKFINFSNNYFKEENRMEEDFGNKCNV
jgi:hypothetical protein